MRNSAKDENRSFRSGFTMTELLIVMAIILVLMGISIPTYNHLVTRAENGKCIQRMKGLWTGMRAYMDDKKSWPQLPESISDDEEEFWKWWLDILEPYQVGKEMWLCPSEERVLEDTGRQDDKYVGSYIPSNFDGREYTPNRWNQPWFMERADFHGNGGNMIMQDGTVKQNLYVKPYGE